jgi:CDP-2,3-bis-(O-geranylgeranyl)-sn-glycerol synthase
MMNIIFAAIWFILPAYIANMSPVLISKIKFIQKYNKPMDFGAEYNKKRLLGPGKTWFGFIAGVLTGTIIGSLQGVIFVGFILGLGALLGDAAGSLIKRRMNIDRGKKAPLLDQLDFIFGAFLFAAIFQFFNISYFLIIIIITPVLHLFTNIIGHKLRFKSEPW